MTENTKTDKASTNVKTENGSELVSNSNPSIPYMCVLMALSRTPHIKGIMKANQLYSLIHKNANEVPLVSMTKPTIASTAF